MSLKVEDYQERYEESHDKEHGRMICVGLAERHDWIALHQIADWCEMNDAGHGYDIFACISIDDLDHYNLALRPKKGSPDDAIRRHKDTICVISLHGENDRQLLDICQGRGIPFICWGGKPFEELKGAVRRDIGTSPMLGPAAATGAVGLVYGGSSCRPVKVDRISACGWPRKISSVLWKNSTISLVRCSRQ
jgi:hypothetical protein